MVDDRRVCTRLLECRFHRKRILFGGFGRGRRAIRRGQEERSQGVLKDDDKRQSDLKGSLFISSQDEEASDAWLMMRLG